MLLLLLVPPLLWLGIVYLGSLFALLAQSFFYVDDFTGLVVYEPTLSDLCRALHAGQPHHHPAHRRDGGDRHDHLRARSPFPLAYYMARYAGAQAKAIFYLAVMLPLWSNYLVRVYSWKLILAKEGVISWIFNRSGI